MDTDYAFPCGFCSFNCCFTEYYPAVPVRGDPVSGSFYIQLSRNLVETTTMSMDNRDVLSFGGDFESERLLQILHSNDIMDHVAKKFNLMEHYKINPKSPFPENQLKSKFHGNVKIRRTEFMSIEIGVLDTDPQMASDIANEIVVLC